MNYNQRHCEPLKSFLIRMCYALESKIIRRKSLSDVAITSVDQITAARLTEVLTHSGALTHGAVASFDVDAGEEARLSTSARLHLEYTAEAQGALPHNL